MSLQSPSLVTGNNVTHKVDESVSTLLLFLLTIYCTTVLLTLVYKFFALCIFIMSLQMVFKVDVWFVAGHITLKYVSPMG